MSLDDNKSKIANILAKAWGQTNKSSEAISEKPLTMALHSAIIQTRVNPFLSPPWRLFFFPRKRGWPKLFANRYTEAGFFPA